MEQILRFVFERHQDREAIEADLALAIFAAECLYGRPRVRMEASYLVEDDGKQCILRASGEAGDAAARILTGLTSARLGEDGFSVQPVSEVPQTFTERAS